MTSGEVVLTNSEDSEVVKTELSSRQLAQIEEGIEVDNFELKEKNNTSEESPSEGSKSFDVFYKGKRIGQVALLEGECSKDSTIKGINLDEVMRNKGLGKALYN